MYSTTTVYSVMLERAERGMADLLIQVADYFYCKGAGLLSEPSRTTGMADLLTTLEQRYEAEIMAARNWLPPPLLADEVPGWLLAHCERQALEQGPPAEGWGAEGWPV